MGAALQSPAPTLIELNAEEEALRQADVPQAAVTAMLQYLTYWYENREAVTPQSLKVAQDGGYATMELGR